MDNQNNLPNPIEPQPFSKSDAEDTGTLVLGSQVFEIRPPTTIYAMAYGSVNNKSNNPDIEYRLQRLEKGNKIIRRGRVVATIPQFRSQGIISQTSANNPFTSHNIGGVSYPSGRVPDIVAPFTNNSNIKIPDKA